MSEKINLDIIGSIHNYTKESKYNIKLSKGDTEPDMDYDDSIFDEGFFRSLTLGNEEEYVKQDNSSYKLNEIFINENEFVECEQSEISQHNQRGNWKEL